MALVWYGAIFLKKQSQFKRIRECKLRHNMQLHHQTNSQLLPISAAILGWNSKDYDFDGFLKTIILLRIFNQIQGTVIFTVLDF